VHDGAAVGLAVRRPDGHLPVRAQADPGRALRGGRGRRGQPLATVPAHHAAVAVAGDLLQPGAGEHPQLPDLHLRLRHRRWAGWPGRRHQGLHPAALSGGLRGVPHRLRLGAGVGVPDGGRPVDARVLPHRPVLGPLRRQRGALMVTLAQAPAQRRLLSARGRNIARTAFVLLLLAVVLYPIVWLLATSFKTTSEIPSNISVIPHEAFLADAYGAAEVVQDG